MVPVLNALRRNKSVAHAYLQVPPTKRFAAAPEAEMKVSIFHFLGWRYRESNQRVCTYQGKDENIVCNGDRGQLLRKITKTEGKKAKKEGAGRKRAANKKGSVGRKAKLRGAVGKKTRARKATAMKGSGEASANVASGEGASGEEAQGNQAEGH